MLSQPVVNQLINIKVNGVNVFRKVAGAANFVSAQDDLKMPPVAYVIPLADAAKPNELTDKSVEQHVIERFGIILAVGNSRDSRGDAVNAELETLRKLVIQTLLGFVVEDGYDPIQYGGGRILQLVATTLWWQLDFITGYFERKV
jgi:hypothetical protein